MFNGWNELWATSVQSNFAPGTPLTWNPPSALITSFGWHSSRWEAINFALENDNFSKYFNLLKLVSDPFKYKEKYVNYYKPPDVLDENFKTFCGT